MFLETQVLYEVLFNTKYEFKCDRCGFCCYRWGVKFPDGSYKPPFSVCKYIDYDTEKNIAVCTIYENRPRGCKLFFACPYKFLDDKDKVEIRRFVRRLVKESK